MTTYIALFRGINVGGRNVLKMKELTALLEGLGAKRVKTYIQSGNVVLAHEETDGERLAGSIRVAVQESNGFEPQVLLLSAGELEAAMANNPFPEAKADARMLHVGFLAETPAAPDLEGLERLRKESERFVLDGRFFYLHAPEGIGRSKLAAGAEQLLGVAMTDRNWRTVTKLREMVEVVG